jgi:hypothetical protein
MDDTTTDDVAGPDDTTGAEHTLTRRETIGAGAAGLTALALSAEPAGAVTVDASRLNRTVTINAPRDVVFDLDQVRRIQKDILGQLGCQACCSGWTIHFPDEVQYVVGRNKKLKQLSPALVRQRLGVNT